MADIATTTEHQTENETPTGLHGDGPATASRTGNGKGYVLPLVHTRVPTQAVDVGFLAAVAATAALGVVDPPLAVLIGAGALIARHQR